MDDPERLERESDDVARKAHFLFAPLFLLGSESALIAPAFLDCPDEAGALQTTAWPSKNLGRKKVFRCPSGADRVGNAVRWLRPFD